MDRVMETPGMKPVANDKRGATLNTLILILTLFDPVAVETHIEVQNWRRYYGLPRQELDPVLCQIAQQHADWMAANNSFNHGPNDQVIAIGYETPRQVVGSWIDSPPHRAWLLSRNRKAGWAWAVTRGGRKYWAGVIR
jgi:uncharacterized protein YkwD